MAFSIFQEIWSISGRRLLFSHHANSKYKQNIKATRTRLSHPAMGIFIFFRSMERVRFSS
jgi:hypothetical protein